MLDLAGQTVGRLTARERSADGAWICECACGNRVKLSTGEFNRGGTKSCGCLRRERTRERSTKHGHATRSLKHPLYATWMNMRGRCSDEKDPAYSNYGARGIKVCPRWESFEAFLNDVGARPSPSHSLDWIDNDRDYEPDNCRWATRAVQSRNTRRTIQVGGVCLKDACADAGVPYGRAMYRLHNGASIGEALSHQPWRKSA